MTHEIKSFYWSDNAENCIAILNYEFQGVTEVHDDTYFNDESPSCTFTIDGVNYKLYLPSDYKGDYAQFMLLDETNYDTNFEFKLLGQFPTINDVLTYFKNLNVI
jgi:hypothetical protein